MSKWNSIPLEREDQHVRLLQAIRPDVSFALVRDAGEPVAAGLAVADGEWVGLSADP